MLIRKRLPLRDADGKDLPAAFTDMVDYEVIEGYTADQWLALLDRIYLSQPL